MTIAEKLTQIAENEQKVFDAGYEKGLVEADTTAAYNEGFDAGYEKGLVEADTTAAYNEGFDAGKQSEYDAFWDAYQQNGTRKNYLGAFCGSGWGEASFKPKHPITVTDGVINGTQMFWHHNTGKNVYDFAQHCRDNNIVIDFSVISNFYNAFAYSYITTVGEIDFKSVPGSSSYNWNGMFIGSQIVTMEKLVFYETNPVFTDNMFQNCTKLENLTVDGVIAKSGLNLQWSTKLSKASIESVIGHLFENGSDLTVTFSRAAVDKAFETSVGANDGSTGDEWANLCASPRASGWTISLI